MIQDERYSGHIEPATFLQIAAQTGFNATCLKNEFIACAIRNRQHRTTDIYIKRSKVMPQAGEQLSTDHFPGTDTIWNHNDIQFNHCRESSITFEQQRGHTYHILMHEIGHALGLHGGEDRQKPKRFQQTGRLGPPKPVEPQHYHAPGSKPRLQLLAPPTRHRSNLRHLPDCELT